MTEINFGIIGCGLIGGFHARAIGLIPGAKLLGVFDNSASARESFGAEHGVRAYDSYDGLLKSGIDAVCLCTPSGLHREQAVAAAEAGVHVVVEKPMAINIAEAEAVIGACEKNNIKLTVISQLRFTCAVKRVRRAVGENRLGRLVHGSAQMKYYRSPEYYSRSAWRGTWALDGGGALMNQGIHGVDLLQHIMGPVRSVFGMTKTLARDIEVEDTAVAALEFANGALGVIEGTTCVYPGFSRILSFSGDKGSIVLEEDSIIKWEIENEKTPPDIGTAEGKMHSFNDPAAICLDYHVEQLSDMVNAIRSGGRPAVDQYEGLKAVKIICAIYESSRSGEPFLLS